MNNRIRIVSNATTAALRRLVGEITDRTPDPMIVYGLHGCGKTENATRIAEKYGYRVVLDGFNGIPHIPNGVLVLHDHRIDGPHTAAYRQISVQEAIGGGQA